MNLVQKQKFTINDHLLVHDWALTENYYIVVANRVKLNSLGKRFILLSLTVASIYIF